MTILKLKIILFFIMYLLFITSFANATTKVPFENMVINENSIINKDIKFENSQGQIIDLKKYKGEIVILNFWATWCDPCREEMISLDKLQTDERVLKLKIFPINIEKKNLKKTEKFFNDLNIKNLSVFFDPEFELVKIFSLRGVPTTVIINRKGEELAKVIGAVDFLDKKFINWISKY